MTIDIKSIHFTVDQKLTDYISEKIEKLNKYYEKIIGVEVFLKLENSGQIKDKIVELKLRIPGSTLVVSEVNKTFEAAFDAANENIKRLLVRKKEKTRVRA